MDAQCSSRPVLNALRDNNNNPEIHNTKCLQRHLSSKMRSLVGGLFSIVSGVAVLIYPLFTLSKSDGQ